TDSSTYYFFIISLHDALPIFNVLGCILGPLFACYVLLPTISERYALILLSLPFFVLWLLHCRSLPKSPRWRWGLAAGGALACSRSEEHTSELQYHIISYAVFC